MGVRRPRGPPRPPRNDTSPWRPGYPYYGWPDFPAPPNRTLPTALPSSGRAGLPGWGDETDLWEPICVKVYYIMGLH